MANALSSKQKELCPHGLRHPLVNKGDIPFTHEDIEAPSSRVTNPKHGHVMHEHSTVSVVNSVDSVHSAQRRPQIKKQSSRCVQLKNYSHVQQRQLNCRRQFPFDKEPATTSIRSNHVDVRSSTSEMTAHHRIRHFRVPRTNPINLRDLNGQEPTVSDRVPFEYVHLGKCTCVCRNCGAMFWECEKNVKSSHGREYNKCRHGGRLSFPRLHALKEKKHISVADKMRTSISFSFRRPVRGGVESQQHDHLSVLLDSVILSNMEDRWFWDLNGDGVFRVKDVRILLDEAFLPKMEVLTRWIKSIPIKVNVRKFFLDRLPTRSNLAQRNVSIPLACPLCDHALEDSSHLFFGCFVAKDVQKLICR
nr:RNA-directed DNA polymerase, eukaryota [Tanacetum cinerariifolium]